MNRNSEGLTDQRAKNGQQVANYCGRLCIADKYLHKVGQADLCNGPSDKHNPKEAKAGLGKEGETDNIKSEKIEDHEGRNRNEEVKNESADPVVFDVESIHLHYFKQLLLFFGDYHKQE